VGALSAAALTVALYLGLPAVVAAGLALGLQIIVTGALHEDGLADVADGFWGGHTAERRLEIMRDSHIGSYGTLALLLSVGLRWQALAFIVENDPVLAGLALIAVAMTSRALPAILVATLRPARTDGLGHAAGRARMPPALIAVALAASSALALPAILDAMVLQAALGFGVARLALRKIGGHTGDVLGAAQQIAEIAALVFLTTCI
jgi:adenosylcobinamide-GDP ribazoletransferase